MVGFGNGELQLNYNSITLYILEFAKIQSQRVSASVKSAKWNELFEHLQIIITLDLLLNRILLCAGRTKVIHIYNNIRYLCWNQLIWVCVDRSDAELKNCDNYVRWALFCFVYSVRIYDERIDWPQWSTLKSSNKFPKIRKKNQPEQFDCISTHGTVNYSMKKISNKIFPLSHHSYLHAYSIVNFRNCGIIHRLHKANVYKSK